MDWSKMLAHNIVMGCALTTAFYDAIDEAEQHELYHRHGYRLGACWTPGCGSPSLTGDEPVSAFSTAQRTRDTCS